jgi:hypothetical protein
MSIAALLCAPAGFGLGAAALAVSAACKGRRRRRGLSHWNPPLQVPEHDPRAM